MLKLPNVTLFAIDCMTAGKTLNAMNRTLHLCKFGEAIFLTDTVRFNPSRMQPLPKGLKIVDHKEGGRLDYELAIHREPVKHLKTKFLLHMEWDSGVLNPDAWDDAFLKYDYIGAPWVDHHDPGFPPCDESNNVGNGGFSLKSANFCKAIALLSVKYNGHPGQRISDSWACRTMRPELEGMGIRFATEKVASRFSCENRIYSGQFGFHGKYTIRINGWNL